MRRIAPLLLAVVWLAAPAALRAQVRMSAPLGEGTRVRITAPTVLDRRFAGEVVQMTADTLVLARRDEDLAVPLDAVERIELSQGRDRFRGMLWGAGIGALAGTAAGALACEASGTECTGTEEGGALAMFVGALGGGGAGALAGFAIGGERWVTIREAPGSPFALAAAPAPRGVAVGVALRF